MSIPVEVDRLAEALREFGSGYLLTTAEGRVKVVTVDPVITGGVLRVAGPGRGSLGNVAANPRVTLVFPPREPHGHTLLVDGSARAADDDVEVTPSAAVLHRPAAHGDGPPPPASLTGDVTSPTACADDCHPLT